MGESGDLKFFRSEDPKLNYFSWGGAKLARLIHNHEVGILFVWSWTTGALRSAWIHWGGRVYAAGAQSITFKAASCLVAVAAVFISGELDSLIKNRKPGLPPESPVSPSPTAAGCFSPDSLESLLPLHPSLLP